MKWFVFLFGIWLGISTTLVALPPSQNVSFDFRDTEIRTALKIFAAETGLNIVVGDGVSGQVTAIVEDVPPMEALHTILSANGLSYVQDGKTLIVVSEASKQTEIRTFLLQYAQAETIRDVLIPLLGESFEKISASSKLNTVTIQAMSPKVRQIEQMVHSLDTPPMQVLVRAKIIELKSGQGDTNTPSSIGTNLSYAPATASPNSAQSLFTNSFTSGAAGPGFYAQILYQNVNAYLSVLEHSIGYHTIASPWITATNHQVSEILIGSKLGYRTTTTTTTGTVEDIKFMEVGVQLKFVPHISKDGMILMSIYPSISDGSIVNGLPQENTTETRSEVFVKDGQTIVIGGLTKKYDNKVVKGIPILVNIPFVGYLFGRTDVISEDRDLMILITPKIVTPELIREMGEKGVQLEKKIHE